MTEAIEQKTEQQKVQELYKLIGERGLYVNTNYDIFTKKPEVISLAGGAGYKIPLIQEGSKAYASPLLFATLTSLMNYGTMLITGAPGIGKTTSAEYAGHFFMNVPLEEILQSEILGNVQLKTEDVVASLDTVEMINKGRKVVLPTKFLESKVKIWDEINRTPPDLLSATMKLVDTGKAVYQGVLLQSPPGCLFATANYADEGTFHLTPPFLDRFDVAVMVTSPQPWDLRVIRGRGDEKLNGNLEELLYIPEDLKLDFDKIRKEIKDVTEETEYDISKVSAFVDFVYSAIRFSEAASNDLARATKGNAWQVNQDNALPGHFNDATFTYTLNELSIRTVKAINRYAKAYSWLNGKDEVDLNDVKSIMPYFLWHKVQPTSKALAENPVYANDRIAFIHGLMEKIENEYNDWLGSDALKTYATTLKLLREGKIGDEVLSKDQKRNAVKNAITRIGMVDKPYAITMTSHIASEYNNSANGER